MVLPIDKSRVRAALVSRIEGDLAVATEAQRRTQSGATHEESKAENDKDTRAIEAGYLAGAQAARLKVLEAADKQLEFLDLKPRDLVTVGALLDVDVDGARTRYIVLPVAGGTKVQVDGAEILVLTPEAPLGQSLLEKRAGDVVERAVKGETREYEIVAIS